MNKDMDIGSLPFYWRLSPADSKTGNVVADRMPFGFALDQETGLVIQRRDDAVLEALEVIYRQEYNIGYLQDGNEIAKPYGVDFIRYLKAIIARQNELQRVLEIGCGGCVVLESLKADGHAVLGIDSSPFAASQGEKKKIPVKTGFYPLPGFDEKFSLIFHVDVLEHVSDPVGFLRAHRGNLRDGGLVVVNVPDATESIDTGDISPAMHQHLNYFTESSLRTVLEKAGFQVESIERAQYGGSLYATGRFSAPLEHSLPDLQSARTAFAAFLEKAEKNVARFGALSKPRLSTDNCQLGYYVPLRTLPYIAALNITEGFRFFDDTAHWHGCVFDGVDVKIENCQDLRKNPVKTIIVMSLTFGDVIKRKIASEFGDAIEVFTLAEIIKDSE